MFVQVIRAKIKDADANRAAAERWQTELKPGAKGFLGSTEGVADDGTLILLARFESEDAARANSERPEQGRWWDEMSKTLEEPRFYDCRTVDLVNGGGSDDAKFVQVMHYTTKDVGTLRAIAKEFESYAQMRPDLIGGMVAITDDGEVFDTNYFTSEAEARNNEKQPMTPQLEELMNRFRAVAGDIDFIDLKNPVLRSA